MARKPDDWMPLRIGLYLADTTHLTRDQHGAYLLLLMGYWMRGGALPADDRQLATISKCTLPEWRRMRPVIVAFFIERDGKWFQKRAEEELERARKLVDAKSNAGSLGGQSKWGTENPDHTKTRSQRLTAARAKGTHSPEEWFALISVFQGICVRCRAECGKPVKDHIIPIYKGGSDAIENLQPLCAPCNSSKGPEEKDHRQDACHNWRERLAERLADAKLAPAPLPLPSPDCSYEQSISPAPSALGEPDIPDFLLREKGPKEPDRFAEFWAAYPLKRDKGHALKAWPKALKLAGAEQIIAAAKSYASRRAGQDKQFTKYPEGWLSGQCWLDEVPAMNGSGATLEDLQAQKAKAEKLGISTAKLDRAIAEKLCGQQATQ